MAKTKISEFSPTPGNNTDIDNINIAEGCAPSGINDAIRELMAQLKDFQAGTAGDSFNGPIGSTTAVTGAFTNITASGTLGVTGVATLGNGAVLGTPTSVTLTNGTGLPIATGVSGLGTGVATALAVNVGSAGAPVLFNGALGTPASGTVTNLTGTASININGTVGATTANTGAFTTLAASSTVTLSGGTANGVAFLNASKELTTGSALTFDGSLLKLGSGAALSVQGVAFPASGSGAEIFWDGSESIVQSYNRTSSAYVPLWLESSYTRFGINGSERMRLDSSGNLGLGVTPSAWSGYGLPVLELPSGGTIVSAGTSQNLGANWYYSGGSFLYKTTAAATYFQQASGAFKWYTAPSGTAGDAISFTQAMTLDASGNLGVGTTSPATRLEVNALSEGEYFRAGGGTISARSLQFSNFTVSGLAGVGHQINVPNAGGVLTFATGSTERVRIDSSGNLLVGTTGQTLGTARLCVSSAGLTTVSTTSTGTESSYAAFNTATSGNNQFMWFYTGDSGQTFRGSIEFNRGSGVVAYNTTSDYRAKDIIGPVTDSGSLIDSVPVYIGKMKGATQERPMFIAHETPAYAHTGEKDAVDADGNPVYQQMDASALIPVMWAEIQSLRQRLAAAGI